MYYFTVQNPSEILQGAKPIVTQVGPYAYNEFYVKFNISWSDNGDTVTYNTQKYYLFDNNRTGPGLSEQDTLLLPYPTAITFQNLLNGVNSSEHLKILEKKVVREAIFEEKFHVILIFYLINNYNLFMKIETDPSKKKSVNY